ncbi:MAG: tRNA (N6-threonylcarbamoyladenosine(37)-N6)-methyltransferase TrmO [Fervidicoccaceae archaeon]
MSPQRLSFEVKPIGYVRVPRCDEEVKSSPRGVEGEIEVLEEYAEGLKGIEGFSHLIVLAYLHKVTEEQRRTLLVRPMRLARLGVPLESLPLVGVFCTDSPHRPNPLALTIVELKRVEGRRLIVSGLDLFDGTPVLDIKPYTPARRIEEPRTPAWYEELAEKLRKLGTSGEL